MAYGNYFVFYSLRIHILNTFGGFVLKFYVSHRVQLMCPLDLPAAQSARRVSKSGPLEDCPFLLTCFLLYTYPSETQSSGSLSSLLVTFILSSEHSSVCKYGESKQMYFWRLLMSILSSFMRDNVSGLEHFDIRVGALS